VRVAKNILNCACANYVLHHKLNYDGLHSNLTPWQIQCRNCNEAWCNKHVTLSNLLKTTY